MSIENPFFLKELRALGRRRFAPIGWALLLQSFLLLFPLLIVERLLGSELEPVQARQVLALVLLGISHAILCGAIGWTLGRSVFLEEHRQRTLESVRLVSTSPWRWLPQKLLFPLYGLLLVWAAGLPFYAALALRRHFPPHALQPGAVFALCGGLVMLGTTLMLPPEGARYRLKLQGPVPLADLLGSFGQWGLPYWVVLVLLRLSWDWLQAAIGAGTTAFRSLPFYSSWLRTDHGLVLLMTCFGLGALGAALANADPVSRLMPLLGRAGRLLAVAGAYYLFVGYTWPGSGPSGLVALFALPAAVSAIALFSRKRPERKDEDPIARGELGWLTRFADNPVFLRDLRVTLRPAGLVRQSWTIGTRLLLVTTLLGTVSILPFVGTLGPVGGPGSVWGQVLARVAELALVLGFWLVIPSLLTFGARALALWQEERRCNTLSQLFSSPIGTRTVVHGRWAAAVLVGLARTLPVLVIFLIGPLIALDGRGLDVCLSLGAWLTSMGLVMSAGFAGAARRVDRIADLGLAVCLSVYVLLAEGLGLAIAVNNLPRWTIDSIRTLLIAYSWTMAPINLVLTYLIYRRSIADLEAYRKQDLE
jgi:hypothetical protein